MIKFRNKLLLLKKIFFAPPIPDEEKRYIRHNRKIWSNRPSSKNGHEILLEINGMQSCLISYSYLANVIAKENNCKIVGYYNNISNKSNTIFRRLLDRRINSDKERVYNSFGMKKALTPRLNKGQKELVESLFLNARTKITTLKDVEDLKIDGVWIGDLLYDTYLMQEKKPTIDLNDHVFHKYLRQVIELTVYWMDYFQTHDIQAINVSHCVYKNAIPLRVAISKDVLAFQTSATHVYRLSGENFFAYNDFVMFPEKFKDLSKEEQKSGLLLAEQRINQRLSGKIGVDMFYSTKSAYGDIQTERVLNNSKKIKVLIATHCFFDSPHSYGNNLFPDFYEWLDFLGKMTIQTDYEWYIKTHPDYRQGTMEIILGFIERYPKFQLLPAETSHKQIIKEGINFALTVYGTIGFEYAALGMPVINASLNNPHIAYDFNYHPRNIEEYESVLLNLKELKLKINQKKVFEYYYMRNIYNTQNWLFNDNDDMIAELGGYNGQFDVKVYDYFVNQLTEKRHNGIIESLKSFWYSDDFRLDQKHINDSTMVSKN